MIEPLRLFLIEDDDDIALLVRKGLEQAGHHVTRCRTAADALIVLGHSSFDLVLLDQRLPDMAGIDLLHTLTREGISVPSLMVTAAGDEQLAARVLRAGALDYVVKDPALTFLAELPKRVGESVTRHRLQQINRLLIAALESARDGIMITDLQGTILHVNQALEDMTGYTRQELLGQNPRLLKSGAHPRERYADLWRTILARTSWEGELTNRRKDGSLVEVSLAVSPIVDSQGQLTHFVGIQRDITERKHLERQLLQAQKMQSVGTLAGGVAHEFNNLLAGINGYAALGLREPGLTEPLRQFLQYVVNLSERAAGLTRQLLTFARKPTLTRQPTGMPELVRATADLVIRTLHIEVGVEVEQDGPLLMVEADANQLQQALVNLALNARDASVDPASSSARHEPSVVGTHSPVRSTPYPILGSGTGSPIVFRLRRVLLAWELDAFPQNVPPGDYVLLEVVDNGCGMSPEVLGQALDPFFTTKDVGKGTGLGLPMVFGIVQGHQGHLAIDTKPGRGTCVGMYLPRLVEPSRPSERGFQPGQVLEPESVPGRSILVVDDEGAVQDVVRRFLEIAGHSVVCACSGQEALELVARNGEIDLVILDLMMPREDGAATFGRLRRLQPGLPVLLCTGLPQAEPAPGLLQAGAAGVLRKPFRMNELWYAVNQALNARGGSVKESRSAAVIWDVDGTLVDTAELHFQAWERLARELGKPFTRAHFAATFGRRNPEIIHQLFDTSFTDEEIAEFGDRKEEYYKAAAREGVELLPGVRPLLEGLHAAGFSQAIGSSAPRGNLDLILNLTKTEEFFAAVVSMEDTQRGKPDPQVFQAAAARLGLLPARCLVLEDAVAGVQAAKAGGMKCVAVAFVGHHPEEALRRAGADRVVKTLLELRVKDIEDLLDS
jgi:HAD superfamily hydrolase (TIGR01509 family)